MTCATNVVSEDEAEMPFFTASQETYVIPGREVGGMQLTHPADGIVSAVRRLIRAFDQD